MFYMYVANVDHQDVTYVVMICNICCKYLFPLISFVFQTYGFSVFI
jgi:hypothetical protein